MAMTAEQLADVEEELRALLIGKGRAPADADEIIDTASRAARQGIASLVAVAGAAQEQNRDSSIILAIHIMERFALSHDMQLDARKVPAGQAREGA